MMAFVIGTSFAGSIKGIVTGASDDSPLIGANVYLQGTTLGAATDEDGIYYISDIEDGTYTLVCDYVGYATQEVEINVDGDVEQNFVMVEFLFSKTISVIADRAKERETPVAYTNVSKAKMVQELGSQDIPMVLNSTPSVYSTMQGGGAGDARINVRGFNQRNVAIMINGVPVNDMENGWVYWSNWDGVGDATASIQMQRGLSAVNLATPSIGGTMNIITDPTALNAGAKFKQEYGEGTFLKTTLSANSGLIDGKYAVSGSVVRKTGDGVTDKTWTDAWAYYFGAAYNINEDNRLELYAVGAPQRHGQNLWQQNIAAYDHDFAKDQDDYDVAALDDYPEASRGRLYNENWGPVSSSYKGKQAVGSDRFDRHDSGFLNERENFYHKPQVNLNWYSNLSSDLGLATVLYYSGGTGGGSGTMGSMRWNYHVGIESPSRFVAWDATIERNIEGADSTGASGILRNSRNDQSTIGLISKLNWRVSDNLKTTFGIDWRTAEIDHFREVRDLLGGQFYIPDLDDQSEFWEGDDVKRRLGDKVGYNNTNTVDWYGAFTQAEYTLDQWTAYGTFGFSSVSYSYVDHFKKADEGGKLKLDSDPEYGFQLKGGAMYRLNDNTEVFANVGYVEKVPIFDNVIDDNNGIFAGSAETEKFTSFEAGANWRGLNNTLSLKGSFYYTMWADRSLPRNVRTSLDDTDIFFLTGLDQLHTGFEFEAAYQPISLFRVDLAGSLGSWEHTSDASGEYRALDSDDNLTTTTYLVGVDGLMIGDAPQTQIAIAGTVFPVQGLNLQLQYRYYDDFYADWDPTDRIVFDGADPDRKQSWQVPAYGLLDFHGSYKLPVDLNGVTFSLNAHVFNILDDLYISDATDNSRFNGFDGDHDADDAEVYMGLPQTFNIGITLSY
ncbi:MAG: TonB-dependent receptor [Calditrichaeota bacterium]|nr:MAG: TonB-dependent receptor [Calditrichota bacterium]MBL1203898.1 TonB-dependent receptor [Calditrichota bacterium]NOG43731.1 TonB-dependent receptor [Calditrichota bacterium]